MSGLAGGAATDVDALDAYSRVVTGVARRLLPSVASVRVTWRGRSGRSDVGSGSAVVITPDGALVTSAHVVARGDGGSATFPDGREVRVSVRGRDALSDLAVITADTGDLDAAELGDADDLVVGQLVVAIGSPLGYGGSVSAGVVSALGRSLTTSDGRTGSRVVENVIQTDASLHPGNSGGALADGRGRVVGINTALIGPGVGQGLGLAVPVNGTTRRIIGALLAEGRVRRAYLGIAGGTRPLPPRAARLAGRERGIEVVSVVAGSPAADAGVRPEDVLLAVDGTDVAAVGELQALMDGGAVGRDVELRVVRGSRMMTLTARPTELP